MELATIRRAVLDDYTLDTPTATVLNRRIAAAVREYSRYNPRVVDTTLTTVADQAAYTFDVPVNGIREVIYWANGTYYTVSDEIMDRLRLDTPYALVSHYAIEDIKEAAHVRGLLGDWEWRGTSGELVLYPTPETTGDTVYVTYYAPHALNDDGDGYDTIPDADQEIIVDLTLAELLTRHTVEAAASPDQAEGLERVTYHYNVANIDLAVARLRSGLIGKYGGTAIYVGP
jgi:hypothetical protein